MNVRVHNNQEEECCDDEVASTTVSQNADEDIQVHADPFDDSVSSEEGSGDSSAGSSGDSYDEDSSDDISV